ncbi:unnamed protein product [Linum trigynum]|uniref:Uncharacterized protein n=1 Tax=Linum trigynum TaxID=586398 RepID=A0AAV2ERV9_9ROSI
MMMKMKRNQGRVKDQIIKPRRRNLLLLLLRWVRRRKSSEAAAAVNEGGTEARGELAFDLSSLLSRSAKTTPPARDKTQCRDRPFQILEKLPPAVACLVSSRA